MNEYQTFEQYLTNIQSTTDGINSIVFLSNWEEIMKLQLSSSKYPALIVETPDVNVKRNGNFVREFDTAIAVVKGCPKGKIRTYYAEVKDETLDLLTKVIKQIDCDDDVNSILDAEIETTMSPIEQATADNCYGWRIFIKLSNIELP